MTHTQRINYLQRLREKETAQIAALQRSLDRYKLNQFEKAYGRLSIN